MRAGSIAYAWGREFESLLGRQNGAACEKVRRGFSQAARFFYPAQDDAGGATAFGHQSIAHGCAPDAMK